MDGFAQRAGVGVVIHYGGDTQGVSEERGELEIVPAADVGREGHALIMEIDGAAEADAAALKGCLALPLARDPDNLLEHPIPCAFAIGGPRFAADHLVVLEERHGELGTTDVDGERIHNCAAAAKTSAGEAVPVPFFMIVTEATRLPKRTASTGDPVTASARAVPAEKLSPAPQISTGCGIGFVSQNVFSSREMTLAPFGPSVTIIRLALQCSRRTLRRSEE